MNTTSNTPYQSSLYQNSSAQFQNLINQSKQVVDVLLNLRLLTMLAILTGTKQTQAHIKRWCGRNMVAPVNNRFTSGKDADC